MMKKMNQRNITGNGRPSGTDGSDFSYRMVVDSRYTKVAQGKSRLSKFIFAQAIIQLLGSLHIILSMAKEESISKVAVSATAIYFISLLLGQLGRKHSKVNLLKLYMFGSSLGILLLIACVARINLVLEVIQDLSSWETKFALLNTAGALFGLLLQLFSISTTISLVCNMAPPKRGG